MAKFGTFVAASSAFIAGNLSSWFVFYVGGGEMFTSDAGAAGAIGVLLGSLSMIAVLSYIEGRK